MPFNTRVARFWPTPPASRYNESPQKPHAKRPAVASIWCEHRSPNPSPLSSLFPQPHPTAHPLRAPSQHPTSLPESTTYRLIHITICSPRPTRNDHHSLLPRTTREENRAPHGCSATSTREPYVETATLERESMCRCCMRGERISNDQSCIPGRWGLAMGTRSGCGLKTCKRSTIFTRCCSRLPL